MMMRRILLAALLGGIAAYAWGALSWSLLPWHMGTPGNLPNETRVIEELGRGIGETGVYTFPTSPSDEEWGGWSEAQRSAWLERHKRGPLGLVIYFAEGRDPMSPWPFVIGLLLYIAASAIAATLLALAAHRLPRYPHRVLFVGALGLFAALSSDLVQLNWGFVTSAYGLGHVADLVLGWLVAGTVIAWRIGGGRREEG